MRIFFELVMYFLQIYIWVILIRVILSWFRVSPTGIWSRMYKFIIEITDPFLITIKKIIPSLRVGKAYIDLSPVIAILVIQFILFLLRFVLYRFL